MTFLNESERYNNNSGYGENEQMEREAIMHFFPMAKIEKVTDRGLQYKGVDYIVHLGIRKVYIDTKVHHYDSNYFVYECFDTRLNYKNYGWTNPNTEHLTNYIVYIVPAMKKAFLYSYYSIMEFQKDDAFKYADFTETKHPNGITYNKIFETSFIPHKECNIIVPDNIIIKKSFIKANSTNSLDVALKIFSKNNC